MASVITTADATYWITCEDVFPAPLPVSMHASGHWVPVRELLAALVADTTFIPSIERFTTQHPALASVVGVYTYATASHAIGEPQVGWCIEEQGLTYWLRQLDLAWLVPCYRNYLPPPSRPIAPPPPRTVWPLRRQQAHGQWVKDFVEVLATAVAEWKAAPGEASLLDALE